MSEQGGSVRLRISEIFYSLQGESRTVGWPTVFIRLTGCPLRCSYCDTEYAFSGGEQLDLKQILEQVASYSPHHVCVTGGEPLAQKGCLALLAKLCDAGYQTSLETSGALDITSVDARVERVVDIKTPASGEAARNRLENIDVLTPNDQIKFVIASRDDYLWSCELIEQYALTTRCEVLMSPVAGEQDATVLAEWILADRLQVRFQLQLHKLLWSEEQGR